MADNQTRKVSTHSEAVQQIREGQSFALNLPDLLHRFAVRADLACLVVRHRLPFGNYRLAAGLGWVVTLGHVTTDLPADRLVRPVAEVLTIPLRHLYAVLWRAGVLEVAQRPPEPAAAPPLRRPPHWPSRGPAPSQRVPVVGSQGTGPVPGY